MPKISIIGTGFVADLYMRSLQTFPEIKILKAYDRDQGRLHAFCEFWGVAKADSMDDVLAVAKKYKVKPDLILNLTNPGSHYEVSKQCLEAGRHVYSEKPLAVRMEDAHALAKLAERHKLILASAPCSYLGEAAQTLWWALRKQLIGKPLLVYAELDDDFISQAPYRKWLSESGAPWPYRDEFLVGCTLEHAGYYLTWLIMMFGSVEKVIAASAELVQNKLSDGAKTAPDFSCATLIFKSGVVVRLTCGIIAPHNHGLRIFGDKGILEVDESWNNEAKVKLRKRLVIRRRLINSPFAKTITLGQKTTHPKVLRRGSATMNFALGPAEVLAAIAEGREPRASTAFALHLNEVTLAIQNALDKTGVQTMQTGCPELLPMLWATVGHNDKLIQLSSKLSPPNLQQHSAMLSESVKQSSVITDAETVQQIKFGIIGTGRMAATMMAAFKQLPQAQVIAVSGSTKARADAFAQQFALAKAYGGIDELLADKEVDAVYIANATENHAQSALAALKAGKSVLCEKPIAISEAETKQIEAEAKRSKKLCMEAMWTLFLPAYQRLFTVQQDKGLGSPLQLYADFGYPTSPEVYPRLFAATPGSGVLLDRGVYPIALALKVFGSVNQVVGTVKRTGQNVDSHAALQLSHANGGISQLAVSIDSLLQNRAVLSFSGGSISLEPPVVGAELVTIQRYFTEINVGDGTAPQGLKATLKQTLRQVPLLRRINQLKNAGGSEYHSFGVNQYLPMLQHFCGLYQAQKLESEIYPLNLSAQVLRVVDLAKALK